MRENEVAAEWVLWRMTLRLSTSQEPVRASCDVSRPSCLLRSVACENLPHHSASVPKEQHAAVVIADFKNL